MLAAKDDGIEKKFYPFFPASLLGNVPKSRIVFRTVFLKIGAHIETRLGQQFFFCKQQSDEQASHSAVPITERMDHFKLRVHDSGLYERVQVSAAQEFFPVFQKGGDMDGIGRDISRRIRSRAGTANVDLDSAILSGALLFSACPSKEERVKRLDEGQRNIPSVVYGLKSGLCGFFVVDDFPDIILAGTTTPAFSPRISSKVVTVPSMTLELRAS